MRIALVHDWLTGMRGGERVLEALLDLLDGDIEIFTLLHVPGAVSPRIESFPIHTSFVGAMPAARTLYRYYLPLFPAAIERFDLSGFDLVVSSSHCVAKGAQPADGVKHVCYCHTPMRYVWDQYEAYFGPGRAGRVLRLAAPPFARRLRRWDVQSCDRVDAFVANSAFVRERIRRYWQRDAEVVHPPVDVDRFTPAVSRDEFYLIVSALVSYKRVDIAVDAFNRLKKRLVIVGDGPELARLQNRAEANVIFRGRLPDEEVAELMAHCRAFVLPGEEDFGIAAVEAQAAGAPVIALGRGGARETVVDAGLDGDPPADATGIFFPEPDPIWLARAIERFERLELAPAALRSNARRFARDRFIEGMKRRIACALGDA
jgi:glycosyltransferase involved in cell wall biosynthesis